MLTSFVPELFDFLTLSNQAPIYVCPNLLPGEACLAVAAEYGLQPNTPLVAATILLAGGHPRALYYAFNHLEVTGSCMLVADLASKLNALQIGPEDVLELIKHSFRPRKFTEFPSSLQVLAKQGSARFALSHQFMGGCRVQCPSLWLPFSIQRCNAFNPSPIFGVWYYHTTVRTLRSDSGSASIDSSSSKVLLACPWCRR